MGATKNYSAPAVRDYMQTIGPPGPGPRKEQKLEALDRIARVLERVDGAAPLWLEEIRSKVDADQL